MTVAPRLRFADLGPAHQWLYVARFRLTARDRLTTHTHDFAEVFWVEDGAGVHLLDRDAHELRTGDVVGVLPSAVHGFRTRDEVTLVNIAFRVEVLEELRDRYEASLGGRAWPWDPATSGTATAAGPSGRVRLRELAEHLAYGRQDRLALDWFLVTLLEEVLRADDAPGELPGWLADALRRFSGDAEAIAAGVPALVAMAGRSTEHVNRVLRQATGRTTTETVNRLRLTRAAMALRMDDDAIATVAAEQGFTNLSHFYRLFGERYGTTPRRYRLAHRGVVAGEAAPA